MTCSRRVNKPLFPSHTKLLEQNPDVGGRPEADRAQSQLAEGLLLSWGPGAGSLCCFSWVKTPGDTSKPAGCPPAVWAQSTPRTPAVLALKSQGNHATPQASFPFPGPPASDQRPEKPRVRAQNCWKEGCLHQSESETPGQSLPDGTKSVPAG